MKALLKNNTYLTKKEVEDFCHMWSQTCLDTWYNSLLLVTAVSHEDDEQQDQKSHPLAPVSSINRSMTPWLVTN